MDIYMVFYDNQIDELKELIRVLDNDFINSIEFDGYTPLNIAVDQEHIEMTELLLSIGANPNTWNRIGDTPLITAIRGGITEIAKLLIRYPRTDPNKLSVRNSTPLKWAMINDDIEIAILLLDTGADLQFEMTSSYWGGSTFDFIKSHGRTEMVTLLENYFPSFQTLTKRCIRDNRVDASKLPKVMFE